MQILMSHGIFLQAISLASKVEEKLKAQQCCLEGFREVLKQQGTAAEEMKSMPEIKRGSMKKSVAMISHSKVRR
jgi:hypothetical protein